MLEARTTAVRCVAACRAGNAAGLRFSGSTATLLGVARSCLGGSLARLVGVGLGRRHGVGVVGSSAVPVRSSASVSAGLAGARGVGAPAGLAASWAMPPYSLLHRSGATTASHNKSVKADRATAGFACVRASAYV
jgi:hypothetical protein